MKIDFIHSYMIKLYYSSGGHTEGVGWDRLKKGFAGNNA